MHDAMVGKTVGDYQLKRVLGSGGMATVYAADQASLNREVAIKIIDPKLTENPTFLARFKQEVKFLTSLEHPHILPVYDSSFEGDTLFVAMRLVAGGALSDRVKHGPMPLELAARLVSQIAGALDFAHRRKIVHRDLKPSNVLLDEADNAYLMDFGISRLLETDQRLTKTDEVLGTPAYMAPEQWISSDIDGRVDVYALGVLAFELLTGKLPFEGPLHQLFTKHHSEAPPDPRELVPSLPEEFKDVIHKAMAKEPDERYSSAGDLGRAFAAAAKGQPEPDDPPTIWAIEARERPDPVGDLPPPPSEYASRPRITMLMGERFPSYVLPLLLLALIAGGFWAQQHFSRTPQPASSAQPAAEGLLPFPILVTDTLPEVRNDGTPRRVTQTILFDQNMKEVELFHHSRGVASQDGGLLVFESGKTLHLANLHQGQMNPKPLFPSGRSWWGSFSGDGWLLAYHRQVGSTDSFHIYAYDLRTRRSLPLVTKDKKCQWAAFSPDGKRLAYSQGDRGKDEPEGHDIWVLDLITKETFQITSSPDSDRHVAWSPDGKYLVFEREEGRALDWAIFKVKAEPGSTAQRVTRSSNRDRYPIWAPAEHIAFIRTTGTQKGLYLIDGDEPRFIKGFEEPTYLNWVTPETVRLVSELRDQE